MSLLSLKGVTAGYGAAQVLFGVDLDIGQGEVVTLLGRNGMGKTTTVRAIMGLLRPWQGEIRIAGQDLTGQPPYRIGRAGIGLVPEGRQVFPTLSVEENLLATARTPEGRNRWDLAAVYGFFPRLQERRGHLGSQLSGGEQQMLAIGRALMTNPRLLILDEATEGLAPLIRAEIWQRLAELKAEGEAILLIDKNLDALTELADRHYVIEKGEIVSTVPAGQEVAATLERHLHL
ncbi:ABC transporter ATP-binding protein [Paracoccus onubensis]|uniref:ABC transporter ATP-binding protein n=1 Tax=Paracoccus onubensis TaxID=1675788 RepID=UPI002730D300|nr:ABC transporter ATP-binding protein [Paracoccus onubensis]MDP0927689.1 ABC transporter ATP-binding protein [Paracoccus onubensis]